MFIIMKGATKLAEINEMPISINRSLTDAVLLFPSFTMEIKNASNIEQLYTYISSASPSNDKTLVWDCVTGSVQIK